MIFLFRYKKNQNAYWKTKLYVLYRKLFSMYVSKTYFVSEKVFTICKIAFRYTEVFSIYENSSRSYFHYQRILINFPLFRNQIQH